MRDFPFKTILASLTISGIAERLGMSVRPPYSESLYEDFTAEIAKIDVRQVLIDGAEKFEVFGDVYDNKADAEFVKHTFRDLSALRRAEDGGEYQLTAPNGEKIYGRGFSTARKMNQFVYSLGQGESRRRRMQAVYDLCYGQK